MQKFIKIMCINAGSSSLKFKLYNVDDGLKTAHTLKERASHMQVLTSGIIERIGHEDAIFSISLPDGSKRKETLSVKDHDEAAQLLLDALIHDNIIADLDEIKAIGNRIVQGGKYFSDSAVLNDDTEEKIKSLIPLAPLHNAAHLTCIHAFRKVLPNVPQVAVFDTAFHQTMASKEYIYPVPYEYYEKYAVRRYGAHGTSHKYLATVAKEMYFPDKEDVNLITLHIGSGASVTAIHNGKCVATSMGLTPLAGVMMGTRTGDIDPSIMTYLMSCTGKSAEEIYDIYNHKSGLLGLSGISNDTRDIEVLYQKDERATLSMDVFCQKISDYICMYAGKLGHVDMIVCSAGVFENGPIFRTLTFKDCADLLGLKLDEKANEATVKGKEGIISAADSKVLISVIPTDEEMMIALDTQRILNI